MGGPKAVRTSIGRARAQVAGDRKSETEEGAGHRVLGGDADAVPPPGVRPIEAPASDAPPPAGSGGASADAAPSVGKAVGNTAAPPRRASPKVRRADDAPPATKPASVKTNAGKTSAGKTGSGKTGAGKTKGSADETSRTDGRNRKPQT